MTRLIMNSRDQFLMTSDQFEIGDDQNRSQNPQDPEKARNGQDCWTLRSRELSVTYIIYMINSQNEKNHFKNKQRFKIMEIFILKNNLKLLY